MGGIQVDFFWCNFVKVKRIIMAEEETEKKSLHQALIDIRNEGVARRKVKNAARTKARSAKAKARRKKAASAASGVVGLQGLRGFYGSEKKK